MNATEEKTDLAKVKYYPDRFYICLDGFDLENLLTFSTDISITQQQTIFIHEYYHYLTNIASYSGLRQFCLNFVDRYRCITNIAFNEHLDGFPLDKNSFKSCNELLNYYFDALSILDNDDIDMSLIRECGLVPSGKFEIDEISIIDEDMNFKINGSDVYGVKHRVKINISGLIGMDHFFLTFGAIDEFLSASIDEFFFENDFGDVDPNMLNSRPYYPYRVLDDIFKYFNFDRPSSLVKILISYCSINSSNPPTTLINLLKEIEKVGKDFFLEKPEQFLLSIIPKHDEETLLKYIHDFSEELYSQDKIHISQALRYYGDKFYAGSKFKQSDFFYFIRPFFQNVENTKGKQRFLLDFSRIINQFVPPVILYNGEFKVFDKLTNYGESTCIMIATYEIFESLRFHRIAHRTEDRKTKYTFPDSMVECDDFTKFTPPPIFGAWRLALNELGLYRLYLEENNLKELTK
ncbi:MAG: hypothetical protein KF721_10815 [Ignavibacteriaceae bacterium]|nr:hypothetical protein [Ignavibacteriaceae bacterium]